MGAQKITNVGFLSEFLRRHEKLHDRPFCWVLGSGASIQSGIPTGGTLVHQWLTEMHEMEDFDKQPLEKWATEKNLGIKGFDFKNAAASYPFVYQRRYKDYQDEGYAVLEDVMDRAEPSYGYSVLAQIMAGTEHKIAITTNFDNLLADALAVYTNALPLVCGHESLTGYIRAKLRRPLIAKIHRDLLLNPLSREEEISALADGWSTALTTIIENYTPIVIGYGGNDGSLMGFLEKLPTIKGGIFWCYRTGKEPEARIQKMVAHHKGWLVPILGFDELMLQLGTKLQIPDPRPALQNSHDSRVTTWQKKFEELNKKLTQATVNPAEHAELASAREAAAARVDRLSDEKDWWAWELKAKAEENPVIREVIYREGLKDFPQSAGLMGKFAAFMHYIRKQYDEAERLYKCALELDPKNGDSLTGSAMLQQMIRKDYDSAEGFYRRALEVDPNNALTITNFANLLYVTRGSLVEAEHYYDKAAKLAEFPALASDAKAKYHSCFISYSHKDTPFAQQLYEKLVAENIQVWFAPKDIVGGKKIQEQIREGIKKSDKLLIVLSSSSLTSTWVMSELREAFKWQKLHAKRKLFPVRVVTFDALREWECFDADSGKDLAIDVREYFIPDFTNWQKHEDFKAGFEKLLPALIAEEHPE